MKFYHYILIGLTFQYLANAEVSEDVHLAQDLKDTEKRADQCAGTECPPPPAGLPCKKVPNGKKGLEACCPDLECTQKDGTVTKHSGFSGSGSSGSSYSFGDPSTGTTGKGYSKKFSSVKSYSSGGNVDDIKKLGDQMFGNFKKTHKLK